MFGPDLGHAHNSSTLGNLSKTILSCVHPGLHGDFWASLDYTRFRLKKQNYVLKDYLSGNIDLSVLSHGGRMFYLYSLEAVYKGLWHSGAHSPSYHYHMRGLDFQSLGEWW